MAQHTERFVSFRDGKFNVQLVEGGSGDNLLYLHGAGGFTGWDDCLDRLAEEFHVVAPAHPGVAQSEGLEHLDDLWDLVLFYEELLDELGLDRTFVVGHSYGGLLAAELAAQCPQRVQRLALVGSLGLWLEETPVADFFILTRSERERLLWHDGAVGSRPGVHGGAGGPGGTDGGGPDPHPDPGVGGQVRVAHPGQGTEEAGAPDYDADPAAVGRLRRGGAAGLRAGLPGVAAQRHPAGD